MKLNTYETIYILKPDITEEKNLNLVTEYRNQIIRYGGQNIFIQHRGRRHLSYNIDNCYDGVYIQMNYEGSNKLIRRLEKLMKLNSNVIRYLTIKQESVKGIIK
uniref:Small ribosomal subunit protein bS6c n=1 Tax=Caulacanthus okamurae TaxID=152008 RepID=A0A6H1U6S7_9FLOR|nr:30S ribosomal protein S6 [Caulacanthus okamurae]QIZ74598.1 30S ribosomal protein S6 [Caulacanthus okamurae]